MKYFLSFIVVACLLVLLAECESLTMFICIKSVALLALVVSGKILTTYFMTSEDLNEEI